MNQTCYQFCLDYAILVLQKWVISYSTVILTLSNILFLLELKLLPMALWLPVTASLSAASSPWCCLAYLVSNNWILHGVLRVMAQTSVFWIVLDFLLPSFPSFCFECLPWVSPSLHLSTCFPRCSPWLPPLSIANLCLPTGLNALMSA